MLYEKWLNECTKEVVKRSYPCLQVADTLERRSSVIEILTDAVKAYQAADVMETQGEVYLKNLGMLSDSLHDLKDRHEGTDAKPLTRETQYRGCLLILP